ncbi:MAG: hypothetical protein JXB36_20290 [Gammaproteobacteria bacterium]|nr:hypothetical protein [Gammaproteobacteria bacterium]
MLLAASAALADGPRPKIDPVGTWNCLIFGPYGNQRMFLGFADDDQVFVARITDASRRRWSELSQWRSSRGRITFTDRRSGRVYVADDRALTLGGTWRSEAASGGWWCSPVQGAPAVDAQGRPPSPAGLMTELVPAIMQSPNYPRQAIRDAKEGRAVSCFFVNGIGETSHAELIELSDEIFRGPVLVAVTQSSYRAWGDEAALRPACRNFTFELDTIR